MIKTTRFLPAIMLILAFALVSCSHKRPGAPRVLVFTKTAGFYHASIPDGVKAIQKLGAENGFLVDTTSDAGKFTEDTLKQYSAIIFLSTTHEVLDYRQQADFERYIEAGGGWVGIHAATDCGYTWPWYGKLSGAYFTEHPEQQEATLDVVDKNFPGTKDLPAKWTRKDEWYNFRDFDSANLHVLVTLDESSYKGGTMGRFHPVVWYHDYDGGRAFYMELGHTSESYTEPNFLKLLLGGIQYAIGKNLELNYGKATALRVPDEDRFSITHLSGGLEEPEQLTFLPDTSILITERRGQILYFPYGADTVQQVAQINVYDKATVPRVNSEEGLLGIAADPDYKSNHWVYIYYAPFDKVVDRLSRFKFENGKWDMKSEQTILEVPTERNICCHTGGSIAFGSNGDLFLSVGDNTTPFDETDTSGKAYALNSHAFAPLDDRPGFDHFDDRRAAGNSNDLRGKILRIRVKADGTYEIPTDNLFPPGEAKTRPEIYVMGDRNPYRISVDQHTGYLYWGEVGPDAPNDSMETRGPRGYDEFNQARKAGNFGWPYFIGPNLPYREYDYATGKSGIAFDPAKPVNNSRNNTGLNVLPPAQPAFIWYPYAASEKFPILGSGGRCAMAGPVYYADDYPKSTRLPDYYNGKLFIYDFVRDWMMAVTMNKQGDLQTIEPFMPHTRLHSPMDMKLGPDGKLYILEYGTGWFTKNADAALIRIDYNPGNRPPVVSFKVNSPAGALPFTLHLSAKGTYDPDGDKLTYVWNLGNGVKQQTDTNEIDHTFSVAGDYPVSVEVSDNNGATTKSQVLDVYAGNSIPQVKIDLTGNSSFYFPGKPVAYKVMVNDKEDGTSDQAGFPLSNIFVKADYLATPDKAALSPSQLEATAAISGKALMESLDCQSCHKIDQKSIGPAFTLVAAKYKNDPKAMDYLPHKIIKGGSGVWGETAMAAHPNLSLDDAREIVGWVLSLADTTKEKSLPVAGSVAMSKYKLTDDGALYLQASYTDKGGSGIRPLTGSAAVVLKSPLVPSGQAVKTTGFSPMAYNGSRVELSSGNEGSLALAQTSLFGVSAVELNYGVADTLIHGWKVEAHLDSPGGQLLGETVIGVKAAVKKPLKAMLKLSAAGDNQPHDLYFVFHKVDAADKGAVGMMSFRFIAK